VDTAKINGSLVGQKETKCFVVVVAEIQGK
jgi:hypothetical protein